MMQLCFNCGIYTVTEQPRSSHLFYSPSMLVSCLEAENLSGAAAAS